MKTEELTLYRDLLGDIKIRVRAGQHRAALSANAEMIAMYWDIGSMIALRQKKEGWGAGVIPRLAVDLKNELPEEKGFSVRNLKRMLRFYQEYSESLKIVPQPVALLDPTVTQVTEKVPQAVAQIKNLFNFPIVQRSVAQLPWGHNIQLFEKLSDLPTRLWYAERALLEGWSRDALIAQIKNRAHERQGTAITNFDRTLPEPHAAIAQSLLKDPYLFDFLTLEEPFHERELEQGLCDHIQKFLLELGRGFAFVGRQYHLEISERDFYLDLLFYHLHLRCFIVVDLKKGEFKPEYAGKMNFYCSAVDDLLRHEQDAPTIGLILCQNKDQIFAEYALRDIQKPIGLADYEFTRALPAELASSLPSIETLENELADDGGKEDTE